MNLNKLKELLEVSAKLNFEFTLQKEGDVNYITYDLNSKSIVVNVINEDDENLPNLINEKVKELSVIIP